MSFDIPVNLPYEECFTDIKKEDLRNKAPFFTEAFRKMTNDTKYTVTFFKDGDPGPNAKHIQYAPIQHSQLGSFAADWIDEIYVIGHKKDMSVETLIFEFGNLEYKSMTMSPKIWSLRERKWIANEYAEPNGFFKLMKEGITVLEDLRSIRFPNGKVIHDIYYLPGVIKARNTDFINVGYWLHIAENEGLPTRLYEYASYGSIAVPTTYRTDEAVRTYEESLREV